MTPQHWESAAWIERMRTAGFTSEQIAAVASVAREHPEHVLEPLERERFLNHVDRRIDHVEMWLALVISLLISNLALLMLLVVHLSGR